MGVASIIAVMAAISVVRGTMEKEMSTLGAQALQIQKWPNGFSTEQKRPAAKYWLPVILDEANALRGTPEYALYRHGTQPVADGRAY
jgi:putative ABC transport system permease protein